MNELTTTQKDFISFLSDEFNKLNNTESNKPFNVIDINALNHEMIALEIERKEITVYNTGMFKLQNETVTKFVDLMNEDFKRAEFPVLAVVRKLSDGFGIEVVYENMKSISGSEIYGKVVKCETGRKSTGIMHGLHSVGYRLDSFCYKEKWDADQKFDSPQAFFNNPAIQKQLLELITVSKNLKEFGVMYPKK